MTQQSPTHPKGGWRQEEIDLLFSAVQEASDSGVPLRDVFAQVGDRLSRKPNSIRNFYYARVREMPELAARQAPFRSFSDEELHQLLRHVLISRGQGQSVRACVTQLAGGDRAGMLRYQNKYRSTIRSRPELVSRVMAQLTEEGVAYVNPYAGEALPEHPAMPVLQKQAELSGDPQLAQLFSSLDHLLALALAPRTPVQDSDAQRRADRLSAQLDVLRIEPDNEQTRSEHLRTETEGMVTLLKEYIALPKDDRLSHAEQFCEQAAARLSAVECALMEP